MCNVHRINLRHGKIIILHVAFQMRSALVTHCMTSSGNNTQLSMFEYETVIKHFVNRT